ncbi:diguanylate cyclase [Pseudaestuariivita rosea]|uniref:diguanylate cyclase n=1 Tax=Pseudaestuariivita rosea TaxID=2763263 RepID=UPI001ABB393C|nr:diguanylate cyclase [Pseudaestuariivita rosea]
MPGRILIVDDVATNRIVMQVKLEAARYQVLVASSGEDAISAAQNERPDLVLVDTKLPDMTGRMLCKALKENTKTAQIPIIVITSDDDVREKMGALEAGAEEFLCKPIDDMTLLARVRSLLRARDAAEELRLRDGTSRALGFAEDETGFIAPAKVALIAADDTTAKAWQNGLKDKLRDKVEILDKDRALDQDSPQKAPDVFVISAHLSTPQEGLRLLTDLRSRAATRHSSILIVLPSDAGYLSAIALDLGANDLINDDFESMELALRLRTQIKHKRHSDRLRAKVRDGLQAAVTDPLTGLYNRRYAMPHLTRIAERAQSSEKPFAVMLLDLDYFKSINDRYGHAAGDDVLIDVAKCLQENLRAVDLIARIGGEEFLIAMPDTSLQAAKGAAKRLCRVIHEMPIRVTGYTEPLHVSVSIGVAMGGQGGQPEKTVQDTLQNADKALYEAKSDGRNQVTVSQSAA